MGARALYFAPTRMPRIRPVFSAITWRASSTGKTRMSDSTRRSTASRPTSAAPARAGFEHSPWQLVEHIRIAQDDILDFCMNAAYKHTMKWPDDYWPKDPAPPNQKAWEDEHRVVQALARRAEARSPARSTI